MTKARPRFQSDTGNWSCVGLAIECSSPRIKYTSKIKGVVILWVFFKNGNPQWALPGLKPLHLAANFGLIFTFRKKEFQFYDFFLGLMIFTFVGRRRAVQRHGRAGIGDAHEQSRRCSERPRARS